MRISVQACIEGQLAQPSKFITVGVLEREDGFVPSAGLGLFLRETQTLLKQLQQVFLEELVDRFFEASARCLACSVPLGIKDTLRLVYRTTFGKASLKNYPYYAHCSFFGFCSSDEATVSPLTHAQPCARARILDWFHMRANQSGGMRNLIGSRKMRI